MIALALALVATAGTSPARLSGEFLSAAKACVGAVSADGLNETRLADAGWIRVTTDGEEAASKIRTYARRGAVPIYLTLKAGIASGCIAQADALPQGGLPALFAEFDKAFGQPKLSMGSLRQWQHGDHSILFSGVSRTSSRVAFAINHVSGAAE